MWISFGSRSSSLLMIRARLVDGGPRPWDGLSWATPRTSSRSGRLRIGCRACCSCRFRRRRQARTDSILTSVRSIKPQKSNVSFPSVLDGPMSGSVTRRGWYSPTLKAMSSASLVDGFGPIPRSRQHGTALRSANRTPAVPLTGRATGPFGLRGSFLRRTGDRYRDRARAARRGQLTTADSASWLTAKQPRASTRRTSPNLTRRRPGRDSSGSSCCFGKRDLLAAFKEEPHKRQEQHKF